MGIEKMDGSMSVSLAPISGKEAMWRSAGVEATTTLPYRQLSRIICSLSISCTRTH